LQSLVETFRGRHAAFLRADLDEDFRDGTAWQLDQKFGVLRGYRYRLSRELHLSRTHQIVATTVGQAHCTAINGGRQILAAFPAYMSLHLEDIGEIGGEGELQRHLRIEVAEVRKPQPLEQSTLAQEPATFDMDDALRNRALTQGRQGQVRQVRREQGVVLADRRAQKRWPPAGDGKLEARQHARVVREQTVIAPLNISEGIGKQESVRVLQRESRQQSPTFTGLIRQGDNLTVRHSRQADDRCASSNSYRGAFCAMFMSRRTPGSV